MVCLTTLPLLPFGCVLLLLLVPIIADVDASSVRKEDFGDFPQGVFSGAQMTGQGISLLLNRSAPGKWTKVSESGPSARSCCAMAFDSARGLLVVFGGESGTEWFNDTWAYSIATGTWTQMKPATHPPGRSRTTMVYDSVHGRIVLFGGYVPAAPSPNDTWVYDAGNNTWTDMHPASAPTGRYAHAMIFDSARAVTVLFGGKTGPEDNDTWTYDLGNNSWTNMAPPNAPPGRMSHAMSYDTAHGTVILFGGYSGGDMVNDTWSYDTSSNMWSRKGMAGGPGPRENHAIDYDPASGQSVLFGGWSYAIPDYNDTWTYDAGKDLWTIKMTSQAPSCRSWHRMVNDPVRGVFILFGGLQTFPDGYMGDTWVYDPREYVSWGTYESNPFNTGGKASFGRLEWDADMPALTSLKFQVRTSNSYEGLGFNLFTGPDGTSGSWYDKSGLRIDSSHNGSFWFQYRALLSTENSLGTPLIHTVTIRYNLMHSIQLLSPVGGKRLGGDEKLIWSGIDPDGDVLSYDIYLVNGTQTTVLASGLSSTEWTWDTRTVWRGTVRLKLVAQDDDSEIPLNAEMISGEVNILNNNAPVVHLSDPAEGSETGQNMTLAWSGSDPDNDQISYSVFLSEGRFDPSSLPFPRANTCETALGVSGLAVNKTYYWAVLPYDGIEPGKLSEVRRFTVSAGAGNRAPRMISSPPLDALAGREYIYLPEAVDDDHDPLLYSLVSNATGMTINSTTHRVSWTPEASRVDDRVLVIIRVTDGRGGAAEQNFTIHVLRPGPVCHFTSPGDGDIVNGTLTVKGNATGALSGVIRVEIRTDGGGWIPVAGTSLWSQQVDTMGMSNGEHRLEARAYDGYSYSDIELIHIRVSNPQMGISVEGFPACGAMLLVLASGVLASMMAIDVRRRRPG